MRIAVDGIYFGHARKLTPEALADLAVAVGADGLNWPVAPGLLDLDDEDSIAAVHQLLTDRGLAAVSFGMTNQISAAPGQEEAFRAMIARATQVAPRFGVRVLDCWPCLPGATTKPAGQATLAANMRALDAVVGPSGRMVAFEFEPDTAMERYGEALQFVRQFGPWVRLTADTYHIQRAGDDLVAAGKAMRERLGIIHISGSHRGEPGSEGDACDHLGFVRAAREGGFEGDLVLQYRPPEDTEDSLRRGVALCRDIVAKTE
jgi:sugar phosphate isomerase/epimerase